MMDTVLRCYAKQPDAVNEIKGISGINKEGSMSVFIIKNRFHSMNSSFRTGIADLMTFVACRPIPPAKKPAGYRPTGVANVHRRIIANLKGCSPCNRY